MDAAASFLASNPLLAAALALFLYWLLFRRASGGGGGGGAPATLDLSSLLPAELLRGPSRVATAEALADADYVLLYASAHWCPPCRAFTPRLSEFYSQHGKRLRCEVIFCSLDRDEAAFDAYRASMSWRLAVPWPRGKDTVAALQVWGIPALFVVERRTGLVLSRDGVQSLGADPAGAEFPWPSRDVVDARVAAAAAAAAASAAERAAPVAAAATKGSD